MSLAPILMRRAGLLLVEALFSVTLFLIAIWIALPVFLTPLQDEPEPPLASRDILASLHTNNILGYAPNNQPYVTIMNRAGVLLGLEILSAQTEYDLNEMLYNKSSGAPLRSPVIWVIWKPKVYNIWTLSIRSTERARFVSDAENRETSNPHLRAGFLAVQLAISQAIIEHSSQEVPNFEVTLVSMPVSPLMEEGAVRQALSGILLCFTLALIPPVLETEALVVTETVNSFKRALRLRNVGYGSMYVSWLVYAYLTCLPICVLASITLILIFRWIHLFAALLVMMAYASVMIMVALMMGMFHSKASIACIWSTLFTLMQTYLAELLVHHEYDLKHSALTFVLHLILPPIGLVHALNKFALLQTAHESETTDSSSLAYMVISWCIMNIFYFGVLMMLQRTIGQKRAIGGQVSWKSIIFKKIEDHDRLHTIESPTGSERGKVQEVDEFVAKAVSFRDVSKSIMGAPVLSNITFDIYRGEFTVLFAERIQETMLNTIEDLLTGLTFADHGSITVLGEKMEYGTVVMTSPHMMGYCHHSETLIEDLTVQEHFTLFSMICLWKKMKLSIFEYAHVRTKRLLKECDLESVKHERVRNLNIYYKAQLCWAIAMLLEPRVIMIPAFTDHRTYVAVIKDKIMQFKKYKTIVSLNFSSSQIEYADRIFVFDSKILVFGGTPAYMFFKYGREYRVRMTMKSTGNSEDNVKELLERAERAGATVRAHLGSLLILRLPASPTATVAELVKDLTDNSNKYGLTSFNITVADSDEVCRRAIMDSRSHKEHHDPLTIMRTKAALFNITEPVRWIRRTSYKNLHLGSIAHKFFTFHIYHKLLFTITLLAALTAGVALGLSLSSVLTHMDPGKGSKKIISGGIQTLSVENLQIYTTLVLRADNSTASRSIAHGYVLSDTKAKKKEIKNIDYTALPHTESLTEYLVTRAIDSPQLYVYMYAYGMDVSTDENGTVYIQALYSPIHHDHGAAARSLARVFMALLRHYSKSMDATIKIIDDPLALDMSPWLKDVTTPPLFIQFMLILTISHITLLPSKEFGLIRHIQKHAMNFSPARYWLSLYFWDLLLYWILVGIMSFVMIAIMVATIPMTHMKYVDLIIVPFMLTVYGIGCVPQAYIFSLGPRMALNTMTFVIVNLVFGETTILAKIFYGDVFSYAVDFMSLSPQFNMAYAFVKIKQIFLYNSECVIFESRKLCPVNTFHKCCQKCGVLQDCFSRKSYFTRYPGVVMEVIATCTTAVFFTVLLLLIEYRIFYRLWNYGTVKLGNRDKPQVELRTPGSEREKFDVFNKRQQIRKTKHNEKVDTFGDYVLASNVAKKVGNFYAVHNVYLGIGRGEALALSGLKQQGRNTLGEVLAGYKTPDVGNVWAMSKYKLRTQPHNYSQQVSISCERDLLPSWMVATSALELIAALRGVPRKFIKDEVKNYIVALELQELSKQYVEHIHANDLTRLHFAAAVIGAPPIIVLDECTAYQEHSVRRAMYSILNALRKRGHAIFISSSSIESHMPVTNKLAIMLDGHIFDVDSVDNMVERYSEKGYTVVVHLKDEVDVTIMFARYFRNFLLNDTTEVLVNIQVLDSDLTWAGIFEKMEALKAENREVYSYIITVIPIDYIYNTIINQSSGNYRAKGVCSWKWIKKVMSIKPQIVPKKKALNNLVPFEQKYDITRLKELPWSVMFHR
ncbi:ABC transporter A family member 3-like [Spodoptera litura]|uniref:ABC transporter A family member 3-like n=1 Tax=Spodoptera litura TaxID=69820 RepID=A0A9J7IPI2_SPOLT|nr:ABC transporter A family member 3-like [Spodoptera litura]